jgi:hypothetical protein
LPFIFLVDKLDGFKLGIDFLKTGFSLLLLILFFWAYFSSSIVKIFNFGLPYLKFKMK